MSKQDDDLKKKVNKMLGIEDRPSVQVPPSGPMHDMFSKLTELGLTEETVTCTACKQKNRVTSEQLKNGRQPRCGKCGIPLVAFKGKK